MPRATVDPAYTERKDLETCPGGFVVLRRLSYDEYLTRREQSARMAIERTEAPKRGPRRGRRGVDDSKTIVEMLAKENAFYEFSHCIVDHNLEDEDGNTLDFRSRDAMIMLDPRIGEEIATYIDEMNQFEVLDDAGFPSATGSTTP